VNKFLSSLVAIVFFPLFLSTCDGNQKIKRSNLPSTDLSYVNIDGIVLGTPIIDVDLAKYTAEVPGRFEQKGNTYYFRELHIETDSNGVVQKIKGNTYGYIDGRAVTSFSINGTDNISTTNEVVELLGQNHNDYWFDREQKLKAYTFYDDDSKIYASFVYDYNSNGLVWFILSR